MNNLDLLTACASLEGDGETYRRLRDLAEYPVSWASFPAEAERHGMGPLAYHHLHGAGIELPAEVSTALIGSYLRHRHDNQVRSRVLGQICAALEVADIPVLVVKGGALAHMLYPKPALRPMNDLDLLVDPADLERASFILNELGMAAPRPAIGQHGKGLTTVGITVEDTWVGVELHNDLFEEGFPASLTLRDLKSPPLAFSLGDQGPTAHTLGLEDLLWHLCMHLRFHTTVFLPWRLIWITDIIGIAEERAGRLDWDRVRSSYPEVSHMLSLIDCLCPLRPVVRERSGLIRKYLPEGIGQDFDGWPRHAIAEQQGKGLIRIVTDTLVPSEWWLRMHYGLSSDAPAWRQRWVMHPADILRRAAAMIMEQHQ